MGAALVAAGFLAGVLAAGLAAAGCLAAPEPRRAAAALGQLGLAIGQQLHRLFQREGVGLRRLRQAGVQLAVLDVRAEPARQQLDRLIVLGVPAQLAQRRGRCGRTPALGRLVEQRHRPVHADGQHVVAGLEADVLLLELHERPVAVDAGHDRLPGLGIAADLARQLEQLQRHRQVQIVGQHAGRQGAALGLGPGARAAHRGRTGRS